MSSVPQDPRAAQAVRNEGAAAVILLVFLKAKLFCGLVNQRHNGLQAVEGLGIVVENLIDRLRTNVSFKPQALERLNLG